MSDMGIFRTTVAVAREGTQEPRVTFEDVIVDTSAEFNWFPAAALHQLGVLPEQTEEFQAADGRILQRYIGFARINAGGRSAVAAVVFAEESDLTLLGAIGLESLRLRVDVIHKRLVAAGPITAAAASYA